MTHTNDAKLKLGLKNESKDYTLSSLFKQNFNGLVSQSSVYNINFRHDAATEVCIIGL